MDPRAEWIETDGLGGFASGTVSGVRTRRYHAILLHATTPPTGRVALVNGFDAWLDTPEGRFALSSQRYAPGVTSPDGERRVVAFSRDPWPRWTYRCANGIEVIHELLVARGAPMAMMAWRLAERREGVTLSMRPFLSGRDVHATHRENGAFCTDADPGAGGGRVSWRPYAALPRIVSASNGAYAHDPVWYRNFEYDEERARGLDFTEDLASPGEFRWDLARGEAVWIAAADGPHAARLTGAEAAQECLAEARRVERERRGRLASPLQRAADHYIVRRGEGTTIVAGYPWFSDWGRDTFIALRGLCIASGRLDEARAILVEWAGAVSQGMLPNYFPEGGQEPELNSVDASLWYVIAAHDLVRAAERGMRPLAAGDRRALQRAVEDILTGHARGTRFGIGAAEDGLLAAGQPGQQLTWMDARVGDCVITPRIGKPVEIQALWINALRIGAATSARWGALAAQAHESFLRRFWCEERGHLHDVVDVDHRAGALDSSLRPNQIFAVGGLPFSVLAGERARRVVDLVERRLWTPLGLRSLAPGEPGYAPRYQGGPAERDAAYHQGTAWPWLAGPFAEALVRTRGDDAGAARREARARFLAPLLRHLEEAGLGHISEIADAEAPHTPRGCPFQAWSVGEALRLDLDVLADEGDRAASSAA
ncbi:MAG TPA: amylo-alpha-1,6-glucosidase [Kofleriaceae bacterium]|nr:amylo-alpha-1,6-glucosidase [Kofleriaceae bacterium]